MSMPKQRQSMLQYVASQRAGFHVRLWLAQLLVRFIPQATFPHLRAVVYRWAGFSIGRRVRMLGPVSMRGWGNIYPNLSIGEGTGFNNPVHFDLSAPIRIGSECTVGHHVVFITTNHEMGPSSRRGGVPSPAGITIGDGAWVGACVTVLPGVTIGPGAFVAAGSIVTRDIPRNGRVRGNPARLLNVMTDEAPKPRTSSAPSLATD